MASGTPCNEPRIKVISALSMATSVPVPMANPTLAPASAGASFIPSPTMPTTSPRSCSSVTLVTLSCGNTSAITSSTPTCFATASAVARLSPVTIATLMPNACKRAIAVRESSLMGSATATIPATCPSTARYIGVCACDAKACAFSVSAPSDTPSRCISFSFPNAIDFPSTRAVTP